MPNRYYSNFNGKLSAPVPPKDQRREGKPPYPERTRAWPADIGPVGPKRNTVGFPEVKQSAKQHMADDKGKIKKVMHEYKEGELHSGSKKGPKVTSHDQAMAIAMSEAGMLKKKMRGRY